jgi:hypothetical protein
VPPLSLAALVVGELVTFEVQDDPKGRRAIQVTSAQAHPVNTTRTASASAAPARVSLVRPATVPAPACAPA